MEQPLDIPLRQAFDQWVAQQDKATLKAVNFNDGRDEMFFSRYLHQAQGRWYREMINYDPENYIPRISKPVLALNGDKDIMVPAKENLESIKQLLDKGGNTRYKIVELPGRTICSNAVKSVPEKKTRSGRCVFRGSLANHGGLATRKHRI